MAVSGSDCSSPESSYSAARRPAARPVRKAALGQPPRRPSSRAAARAQGESLEPADGFSVDRRDTLSTLVMSEAEERLLSSSSGDSDEGSTDTSTASSDDGGSSSDASSSSYVSSSSYASSRSSAASSGSSQRSSARPRRSPALAVRPFDVASPAHETPPAIERPTSTTPPTTATATSTPVGRRSPTKRRHVFDSPQYRADAFFDPENVAIVRSPTKTAGSSDSPAATEDSSSSTPVAAARDSVVPAVNVQQRAMPLPPVCLSELIAASTPPATPRKTPRRMRPRPTELFDFIARSPHPFASTSALTVATPTSTEPSTSAAPRTLQPVSPTSQASPPSSPDFPPASLIRSSGAARLPQPAKVKQEPSTRTERRKSGKCCSALPHALQVDELEVIELTSGSEMGTPVGHPAFNGKSRMGKRRIILSDSEDGAEIESSLPPVDKPGLRQSTPSAAMLRQTAEVVELSSSDEEPPSPPVRRPPPPMPSKSSLLEEEDDEVVPETEDEGVLHWSPPPPPRPSFKPVTPAARKKVQPLQSIFRQPAVDVNLGVYDSPPSSPVRPAVVKTPAKTPSRKASKLEKATGSAPLNINSKAWKTRRETLALELIRELDASVFDHLVLPTLHLSDVGEPSPAVAGAEKGKRKAALPQGVTWTGRLKSTAGMSRWTRRMVRGVWEHHCCIELSSKVLDTEEKLLSTTAHEMCHLAVWIHHGKDAAPHGKEFRAWGKRVMRARPDIEVTTKHDYEIVRKFTWSCTNCPATYGRDTKSIDIERHACGRCSSRLVADFATTATPAKPNAYQQFIKLHFTAVQAACAPGSSAADVMRELGVRYRAEKAAAAAAAAAAVAAVGSREVVEGLATGLGGLALA